MTEALALLGYALAGGTLGGALLRRACWPRWAPRLGVAAWQVLSGSVLASLVLAGLALAAPDATVSARLADVLHACVTALRQAYATPGDALVHAVGPAVAAALVARITWCAVHDWREANRTRRFHRHTLQLIAGPGASRNTIVVDHPTALVYCLPGRPGTVVLTTAAVHTLEPGQLDAVLAHERAHLRGRHHLALAGARVLARALPALPIFRWALQEQSTLLEMIADDAAVGVTDRSTVARALVRLAEDKLPAQTLGAADVAAVTRVRRLVDDGPRFGVLARVSVGLLLLVVALAPAAIAAGPVLSALGPDYCQLDRVPAA